MLHRLGVIRHEQAEDRLVNPDQVMCAFRVEGALSLDRLALAWDLIQRRHPVLGSSFDLAHDNWRTEEPAASVLTLSRLPADDRDLRTATGELGEALRRPFDLTRGPLARLHAVPVDDALCLVGLAADHMVCDAWSFQVLCAELWQLYQAPDTELPPMEITFPDLVAEEHAWLASASGISMMESRVKMLSDLGPAPVAPLPYSSTARTSHAPAHRASFILSSQACTRLRTANVISGLAPSALAHAALAGALHLISGEERIGTMLAVANRADPRVHRTQGWLSDHVVVVTAGRHDDVRKPGFLHEFREAVVEALDYSALPLAAVLSRMEPGLIGQSSPRPSAGFNPGIDSAGLDRRIRTVAPHGLTLTEVPVADGWGYRAVMVHTQESADGVSVRVSVKQRWFERSTVELLSSQMEDLLEGWIRAIVPQAGG
jgi:hypothetical protein